MHFSKRPRSRVGSSSIGSAGENSRIVYPRPGLNRDGRKALDRWCRINRVALVPCEWLRPDDDKRPGMRLLAKATAFVAYGEPAALDKLCVHGLIANWHYVMSGGIPGGKVGKLAPPPHERGRDEPDTPHAKDVRLDNAELCEIRRKHADRVAYAYRRADAFLAEFPDDDGKHTLRELLASWFCRYEHEPTQEELMGFAPSVEWN
jgi:hypothetical protein